MVKLNKIDFIWSIAESKQTKHSISVERIKFLCEKKFNITRKIKLQLLLILTTSQNHKLQ